ncbi:MAG: ShlB/FhaC/HecB family hemolysin secretion/activation protein [Chlamydiae bacterium]|nr:ShlB/FhaC/HecB family hemolysin secretion/activation protein [Chlamydiota bacterium]
MLKKLSLLFLFLCGAIFAGDEASSSIKDKDAVLVDQLKVLIFQNEYRKPDCMAEGIIIDNIKAPDEKEFIQQFSVFINEPITLNQIKKIKEQVIKYYREKGYPLVGVRVPTGQDISQKRLHVCINLARLGDVKAIGNKYFSSQQFVKEIKTKNGEVIKTDKILQDLEWLNDNPFRAVDLVYEPGSKIGETNIILAVQDKVPFRPYLGYQNNDYTVGGHTRIFGGVNLGNLFWSSQQMNFQFTSASNANQFWAVTGNYIIPLPIRCILKLYADFSHTTTKVPMIANVEGKGWYLGGRYEINLPMTNKVSHDLVIGYDFKNTNNFLEYDGNQLYFTHIDISQFLLRYQATHDDNLGTSSFEALFYISPGHMTSDNTAKSFFIERPGAEPNYVYGQVNFERITKLFKGFSWTLNFLAQVSSGHLLPSEEFPLGGYQTVRGYREDEVLSDDGLLFKNELRFPSLSFKRKKFNNQLQFLAFVDYGFAKNVDRSVVDANTARLLSIGPGLRYNLNDNLTVSLDYGKQLIEVKHRVAYQNNIHSRAHLSVIGSF